MPPAQTVKSKVAPHFVEVAHSSGIDFTFFNDAVPGRYFLPEIMGGGVAWVDFDGDGRLDVYLRDGNTLAPDALPRNDRISRLFRNVGQGMFRDVANPSLSGFAAYGQGAAAGDFDADGFPDLYLTNYGPDTLLHNHGDGTFSDVTAVANVSDDLWSTSAVWCDLDNDLDLDLYVANYMDVTFKTHKACEYGGKPGYCGPGSFHSVPDAVYINRGDGTFIESARDLGFIDETGNGLAVVAADFDDDFRPEIYVANDMNPKFMFTRSTWFDAPDARTRMYVDVAQAGGSAVSHSGLNEAGMGIACADFDGDGRPDIFLTHYYHMKNTLYRNRGNLIFDDDSRRTRIALVSNESLGFGAWAFDYDRDGDSDLFVANGHVLGPEQEPNVMRPQLLMNDGGIFHDVSDEAGDYFRDRWLGRGVAAADYDDDGDLDLAVSHLGRPLALLRNETVTNRRFLGLQLETPYRAPPVGGRIVVTAGNARQILPVTAGGSYLSSSDSRILIGLGDHEGPVRLEIFWPSGRVDRFEELIADRYWCIVEGRPPRKLAIPASEH